MLAQSIHDHGETLEHSVAAGAGTTAPAQPLRLQLMSQWAGISVHLARFSFRICGQVFHDHGDVSTQVEGVVVGVVVVSTTGADALLTQPLR
jgi:hypothetical protein